MFPNRAKTQPHNATVIKTASRTLVQNQLVIPEKVQAFASYDEAVSQTKKHFDQLKAATERSIKRVRALREKILAFRTNELIFKKYPGCFKKHPFEDWSRQWENFWNSSDNLIPPGSIDARSFESMQGILKDVLKYEANLNLDLKIFLQSLIKEMFDAVKPEEWGRTVFVIFTNNDLLNGFFRNITDDYENFYVLRHSETKMLKINPKNKKSAEDKENKPEALNSNQPKNEMVARKPNSRLVLKIAEDGTWTREVLSITPIAVAVTASTASASAAQGSAAAQAHIPEPSSKGDTESSMQGLALKGSAGSATAAVVQRSVSLGGVHAGMKRRRSEGSETDGSEAVKSASSHKPVLSVTAKPEMNLNLGTDSRLVPIPVNVERVGAVVSATTATTATAAAPTIINVVDMEITSTGHQPPAKQRQKR